MDHDNTARYHGSVNEYLYGEASTTHLADLAIPEQPASMPYNPTLQMPPFLSTLQAASPDNSNLGLNLDFDLDFSLDSNVPLDQYPLIDAFSARPSAPSSFDLPFKSAMPIPFEFNHDEIVAISPSDLCYRTETKKIYVCTYKKCNKRFNRIHELHRHHRGIHEKLLPFPCRTDGCARAKRGFPRKDKRNDHERKMHGLRVA